MYIAISMVLGICFVVTDYVFIFFILGVTFVIYLLYYHSKKMVVTCVGVLCVSILYTIVVDKNNISIFQGDTTNFIGVIDSIPVIDGNKMRFVYKVSGEKLQVSYKLQSEKEKESMAQLTPGMFLKINGTLEQPSVSRNDNAFNYHDYLRQQHIYYVLEPTKLNIVDKTSNSIKYTLLQIRQEEINSIEQYFSEESAPFVEALIFGERKEFNKDVEQLYQDLGLVHLLAISGSHITLLIVGGYFCLLRIGLTKSKATVILLGVLPMYMVLAGASPSVVRASIVGMIVLCTFLITIRLLAVDILSISLMVMLLLNPYNILNIGFQLSFVISFCLIISSKYLSSLSPLCMTLAVTVIAQLVALPITLFHFYEISLLSVPLNLLFVPFISFIIFPLSLVSLFLHSIPLIGVFLISVLDYLIIFSNYVLELVSNFSIFSVVFGKPTFLWTILFSAVLIILFFKIESKQKCSITIVCLLSLLVFQYIDTDNSIKVTLIDVGQGDCILLQMKSENYMIDTGGTVSFGVEEWMKQRDPYEVGKDTVVPYLKSIGIRKLDKLIITHGDQDHIGGASAIFDEIKVEELVVGRKVEHTELEKNIMNIAKQRGSNITEVGTGDNWSSGHSQFQVLSPFGDEVEENSRSIVLYTNIGEYRWLFTGDLDIAGEERILKKYPSLEVDILKVGHHGSKTSTSEELLEITTPSIAIISVGENNRYGHPNDEVIERLENQIIFRTDELGMITYECKGGHGTFSSHLSYDTENKSSTISE